MGKPTFHLPTLTPLNCNTESLNPTIDWWTPLIMNYPIDRCVLCWVLYIILVLGWVTFDRKLWFYSFVNSGEMWLSLHNDANWKHSLTGLKDQVLIKEHSKRRRFDTHSSFWNHCLNETYFLVRWSGNTVSFHGIEGFNEFCEELKSRIPISYSDHFWPKSKKLKMDSLQYMEQAIPVLNS